MFLGDIPVVALDRPVRDLPVDFVEIDDRFAAHAAVDHSLTHGYKRIACFGLNPAIHSIEERILGYREAFSEHGLTPLPYVQCEDRDSAREVIRKPISGRSHAQAIFPANGAATILALEAIKDLKVSVPEQLALFSFGDVPLGHIVDPPISAVLQPIELLVEMLPDTFLTLLPRSDHQLASEPLSRLH